MKKTVWLLLAVLLAAGGAARAEDAVTLRATAQVDRPEVRLSDVFTGVPAVADRAIATAPAPGKSIVYDVRVLVRLADQYRLDWKPQSLADRAELTRASTLITLEMIRDEVLKKLAEQNIKGKVEVQFDKRNLEVHLPSDRAPEFALNGFAYEAQTHRFNAELNAPTGAAPVALTGRVIVKRDVPVLTKRLPAGTTLGEADLEMITLPEDRLNAGVITDAAQLIGHELRHEAAEGQPLQKRDVTPPRLITRGSLITMRIQTPYMVITAQGRALQDGRAGEVVRVTNTQSNRTVEGTVTATGVVTVSTAQKMALAE
ncbi:MAG: flagellar basal body P-ring formation protein FlgA [Alphaproteobacteria bacterium]|nr:flagellar basal body P-ring formation protein FlgA [Alphaproteobacteria bacterium]